MNAISPIGHNNPPDPDEICRLLEYDRETGVFLWKRRSRQYFPNDNLHLSWNEQYAGNRAGVADGKGYTLINILGRRYRAHRVAVCMVNKKWPTCHIDHINGDPSDNRIENLREVNWAENNKNAKLRKDSTSGICGVSFWKRTSKWKAQIQSNGKKHHLGYFDTLEGAAAARLSAERDLNFHPNHGRRQ